MLKFWIFQKSNVLIMTIKLLVLIKNLHSKGLERSIKDMGAKKWYFKMFLISFGTPHESMLF